MDRTDEHWEHWGKHAPYFGVDTDERFRHPDAAALDDFFASGESHILQVVSAIRAFAPEFEPTRALDFGCGTGRLLVSLSRLAPVVGVDVSPSMLAEARKSVDLRGVGSRVDLVQSDDRLERVSGTFDLVHSFIVFQHIPTPRGMAIASRLLEMLRPGGVAALHFTHTRKASWLRRMWANARVRFSWLHALANLATGRTGAPMQMNCYSLPELLVLFASRGCSIRTVVPTDHLGTVGAMFYLRREV